MPPRKRRQPLPQYEAGLRGGDILDGMLKGFVAQRRSDYKKYGNKQGAGLFNVLLRPLLRLFGKKVTKQAAKTVVKRVAKKAAKKAATGTLTAGGG